MSLKKKAKSFLVRLIKRGYWYNTVVFPDCDKFWKYNTFNTDVVNLGSTSALHAFCYEDIPIKAANWALGHNPLRGDFSILKNYFGFLNPKGSTVIIPLCPFSSLSGSYSYFEDRYYTLLYCTTIQGYSFRREQQILSLKNNPIPHYPLMAIFRDIKISFFTPKQSRLTELQMEQDSKHWIVDWHKEFSVSSFSEPLSLINQDAIEDAAEILNDMISFCRDRQIRPVILIPPMYHTLSRKFTPETRKVLIESLMKKVKDKSIWFYNYMDDPQFTDDISLFQNSFLMNKKGAKKFTKRVLEDIGLAL